MTLPAPRIPYDRDGTVMLRVGEDAFGNNIHVYSQTAMEACNNETHAIAVTTQDLSWANRNTWFVWIFPELRSISGFFFRGGRSNTTWNIFGPVEWSDDTTNGQDGTWNTLASGYDFLGATKPAYQLSVQAASTVHNVRAVRARIRKGTGAAPAQAWFFVMHWYGYPTSPAHPHVWHPTLDEPVAPDYFRWPSIYGGKVAEIPFRVKNTSLDKIANDVVISREVLTDADPSILPQHRLSVGGGALQEQLLLGSLHPLQISDVLKVHVEMPEEPVLGYWTLRINAAMEMATTLGVFVSVAQTAPMPTQSMALQGPLSVRMSLAQTAPMAIQSLEAAEVGSATFIGSASNSLDGATSGQVAISRPSGTTEGDLMVAAIMHRTGTGGPTAPTGWTMFDNETVGGVTWQRQALYHKVAGSSEPSSYTWSDGGGRIGGGIVTLRNPITGKLVIEALGHSKAEDNANHNAPSVTSIGPETRHLIAASCCGWSGGSLSWSGNDTALWGSNQRAFARRRAIDSNGATGGVTISHNGGSSHNSITHSILIAPRAASYSGPIEAYS